MSGQLRAIIKDGKKIYYTEYKVTPADANKYLQQIAKEQLFDESLYTGILRWLAAPNAQGFQWEEINPKNVLVSPQWTLLLPPSDFATFTLNARANVRRSPRVDGSNIHSTAEIKTKFVYKKSTVIVENGLVWADVTKSDSILQKAGGQSYWLCVKEGSIHHTNPPIDGPVR